MRHVQTLLDCLILVQVANQVHCQEVSNTNQIQIDNAIEFSRPKAIPNRQTDLCAAGQKVFNGTLELGEALRGQHLSFIGNYRRPGSEGFVNLPKGFKALPPERLAAAASGFHIELLDLLSSSAGFTYTLTLHEHGPGMRTFLRPTYLANQIQNRWGEHYMVGVCGYSRVKI